MKLIVIAIVLTLLNNIVQAQSESAYSNWLFMQSDKSLQYRIAVAKTEGNIAYLQLQFKVNADDEVHCRNAICEGLMLKLTHDNIERTETVKHYFLFDKSFEGDGKLHKMEALIPMEFKTWPDGSKRYLTKEKGIVYTTIESGNTEYTAQVFNICVDIRLKGQPNNHRCKWGFDFDKAIVVK